MTATETVTVVVNGSSRQMPAGATVADLIASVAPGRERGIAVAINATVLPRTRWSELTISDGDAVEVIAAVQGG